MITVEDVDGCIYRDGTHSLVFEVDTSLISDESDFTNVIYDFCKVSRSTSGSNITYSFTVDNKFWNGYYYLLESDRTWISSTASLSEGVVSFTTSESSIIFGILLNPFYTGTVTGLTKLQYVFEDLSIGLTLEELGNHTFTGIDLTTGEEATETVNIENIGSFTVQGNTGLARLVKTDFQFECTQSLYCGQVNTVQLGTDVKYKPNGALIGTNNPVITVEYNGVLIPVVYDSDLEDYTFDLDLSDNITVGKVKFTVNVEGNKVINTSEFNVRLDIGIQLVSSGVDLRRACDVSGANIIQLGGNASPGVDVPVKHSIKIIGNDKIVYLSNNSFILDEGVTLTAENITFGNGNPAIIQGKNTTIELNSCTFSYCRSDNYSNLGACIFCDIDIDSLDIQNDFTTILNKCTFESGNYGNLILHGGTLTLKDCKIERNNINTLKPDTSSFLYMVDGEADIINTTFKIRSTSNTFCNNNTNAGYSQCLFTLGENATLNGQTHQQLQDQTPNLCESPYNNRAHIFLKYYYPAIETCVYTSPTIGDENKAYCYSLSGINWVYKHNVQVTRADAGTENPTQPTF